MRKSIGYLMFTALLGLLFKVYAVADEPTRSLETAWSDENISVPNGSKFCYGHGVVPPDLFTWQCGCRHGKDDDPFGGIDSCNHERPSIQPKDLPRCLHIHDGYRDVSRFLLNQGFDIKSPEWIIYDYSKSKLHFCLSEKNTFYIRQAMVAIAGYGPRYLKHRITLVSLPKRGLTNVDWTPERLKQEQFMVHSRYGLMTRSGEKSKLTVSYKSGVKQHGHLLCESVITESNKGYDCKLDVSIPLNTDPTTSISKKVHFIGQMDEPFIIDCGMRGKEQRNYFLIFDTTLTYMSHPWGQNSITKRFDTITGIYSYPNTAKEKQGSSKSSPFIKFYYAPSSLLNKLQSAIYDHPKDDEYPFSVGFSDPPEAPLRVNNLPKSYNTTPKDRVYDIKPQLVSLGAKIAKNDQIYYNVTKKRVLIKGVTSTHSLILEYLKAICSSARTVRVSARIVEVDIAGTEFPTWTMEEVTKRKPKVICHRSSIATSGTASTSGKIVRSIKKKDGTKEYRHAYESEPVIGESNHMIDLRIFLSEPTSKRNPIAQEISTALTLADGIPAITEIGHPHHSSRTRVLIIHADILNTEGTFFRDRFKPIKN